jgi:hypothetical protein
MAAVSPGTYLLQAARPGFFYLPSAKDGPPSPMLTIKPGEQLENVRIEMAPRAIVSGHVLDEKGNPMAWVPVHVSVASPRNIALELTLELADLRLSFRADERGEYRIALPPGKFHVYAQGESRDDIRVDGTLEPVFYDNTYYPGALDEKSAAIVETRAGQETAGVDIRMVRKPLLRIAGIVTGLPPGSPATVHIRRDLFNEGAEFSAAPDGSFTAGDLEPGQYLVYAEGGTGAEKLRSAIAEVDLSADVTNLNLAPRLPANLLGAIEVPANGVKLANLIVRLEQTADPIGWPSPETAPVARDGTFQFIGLQPDRYNMTVVPMPEDGYLKSVRLDDTPVVERDWYTRGDASGTTSGFRVPLDLRNIANGSVLRIVVGIGARISGVMEGRPGRATPTLASVTLLPESKSSWQDSLRTRVGVDGAYDIDGIPPGKYRLLARDAFESDLDSEKLFERELPRAEIIEFHAGDRIVKNLKPAAKEAGDGKPNP